MNKPRLSAHKRSEVLRIVLSDTGCAILDRSGRVETFALPGLRDLSAWKEELTRIVPPGLTYPGRHYHTARVSLLSPLVQIKTIELPKLSVETSRAVVERNAERYFIGLGSTVVVDCHPLQPPWTPRPRRFLCVAANTRVLESINAALDSSGWSFSAVTAATLDIGVGIARVRHAHGASTVVVRFDNRLDLVSMWGRRPRGIRSISTSLGEEAVLDALLRTSDATDGAGGAQALLFGGIDAHNSSEIPAQRDSIRKALRRIPDYSSLSALCVSPDIGSSPLDLLPHSAAKRLLRRQVTRATGNVAIGLLLALTGVGVREYELANQAESDRSIRAQLSGRVARALARRDSTFDLRSRMNSVVSAEERWRDRSAIISTLATLLPVESSLSSLRIIGDTVVLSGVARRAERVLDRMQGDSLFARSEFSAPVEQFAQPDETTLERFSIRTRLARKVGAPSPAPTQGLKP
jgi:Tfp pilus assembly protein PilN